MARAMQQRLPVSEVSYPLGLSCLLHGFLAVVVIYAPPWFGAKPFKIPVSYEVTLVAPTGGGAARTGPSPAQRPKAAATGRAKTVSSSRAQAAAPRSVASQPRDVLTLPPSPARPTVPRPAVQPLPAPAHSDELTVPATRTSAKRRVAQVGAAPPVVPTKPAAQVTPASPPVAPIVAPTVAPPPSLAVARPAPARPPAAPQSPPSVAPRAITPPKVVAPPTIAQPVIAPPVVTPPRVPAPVLPASPPEIDSATLAMAPVPVAPSAHGVETGLSLGEGHGADVEPGVFVGNTDPALAYYFVLIQDKISSYWAPPKIPAGAMATVNVSLRVLRSGQIRELGLEAPSGDRLVDDSAVRAVRLSSPLPPLPTLFKPEVLSLQLRFTLVGDKS